MPGMTRYAKALLSLAQTQGVEEAVGTELTQVADLCADPTLARVLSLPTLPVKVRKDIVEQVATTLSLQPLLHSFLRVLAENDRLRMVAEIAQAYQRLLERSLGRTRAQIRSASPLTDEELTTLVDAFSHLTRKTVVPTVELDPELLGGVVVEIEGRVYDASLKTQLHRLGITLAEQL